MVSIFFYLDFYFNFILVNNFDTTNLKIEELHATSHD